MFTKVILSSFSVIRFLPKKILIYLGKVLGIILFLIVTERRVVVIKNLSLCFPTLNNKEIKKLAIEHFLCFGRAICETTIAWWSPEKKLRSIIKTKNFEYLAQAKKKGPVIVFSPHMVGVEIMSIFLSIDNPSISIYSKQKNKIFNDFLKEKRERFKRANLFSRQEGIKTIIRLLKQKNLLYLLPDMDFGIKNSLFIDFFGVKTATVTSLPRLAKISNATVIPVTVKQEKNKLQYEISFHLPWEEFPGNNINIDLRKMNKFIENVVKKDIAQYYWIHKRFKTRPENDSKIY